jgi:hypothetical protein
VRHARRRLELQRESRGRPFEASCLRRTLLGLLLEGGAPVRRPPDAFVRAPQVGSRRRDGTLGHGPPVVLPRRRELRLRRRHRSVGPLERSRGVRGSGLEVRALRREAREEPLEVGGAGRHPVDLVPETAEQCEPVRDVAVAALELAGEVEPLIHAGTLTWLHVQRTILTGGVETVIGFVRGTARVLRTFALVTVAAVAAIALAFARDGFDELDAVIVLVLLVPPALLLLFVFGLYEVARLPDRLRRMPNQGAAQLAELSSLAGDARRSGLRRAPSLLWRLRRVVGSSRDLVGFALPLRVFAPPFLAATGIAALLSLVILGGGFVALLVLAVG